MNRGGQIIPSILGLIDLFLRRCSEKATMEELKRLLLDSDRWVEAHSLFDRIRRKTLEADRSKNRLLQVQYSFEEICAKTLFNLANTDAPFDSDSPYFVIPFALDLGRSVGIDDEEVIRIVAPRK
jgi:hypothetical protein